MSRIEIMNKLLHDGMRVGRLSQLLAPSRELDCLVRFRVERDDAGPQVGGGKVRAKILAVILQPPKDGLEAAASHPPEDDLMVQRHVPEQCCQGIEISIAVLTRLVIEERFVEVAEDSVGRGGNRRQAHSEGLQGGGEYIDHVFLLANSQSGVKRQVDQLAVRLFGVLQ